MKCLFRRTICNRDTEWFLFALDMGSHNFALVCHLNVLTLLGNSLCPGDHESHLKIKKIDKWGSLEKKKNGSGYNHKITNKNRRYIHQNLDLVDYSLV